MAEEGNPDNNDAASADASGEEVISLEDLDKILEEEDPEFSKTMDEISQNEELKAADIEVTSLVQDPNEEEEESEEEEKKSLFERFLVKFPRAKKFLRPIGLRFALAKRKVKTSVKSFVDQSIAKIRDSILWCKNDLPGNIKEFIRNSKEKSKFYWSETKGYFQAKLDLFRELTRLQKISFFGAIAIGITIVYLIKLTIGSGWLPRIYEPFISSLESKSTDVIKYNSKTGSVRFYDAFPQPKYFILLKKVVVSLKRVRGRGTPMAYGEFYLEVDSQETAIEINDRMSQILDVTQRALEGFTYKEVQGASGKAKVAALIRFDINHILNQGRVVRVYTKSFITKP